ncbi:MAG: nitrate reductase subunit alpha [SAR202 cluster bacterium]|jgi:nitrate reductase alpha subunit|nr:nitrate reductase subunit alpha [SAR202 cluster bacterium]MQG58740.1 nitrate reductase subunit alpha [SAR202 cluster bacterium]MQG68542.1 nitrate reductase subunit alpha [SAR202 cluster bacterium]|tara:strand:- start:6622 stop:10266 length:3645 start_codon:yes stop_codon:yes gene_type:complete
MGWIQDLVNPKERRWEEFYRNRWQHDKTVRSTHGVNCTGGCSWEIYVKDGIITWEMQQTDYPLLEDGLPPYEPRGCQRGISASWYVYSPIRVKYPYMRGALMDQWRQAKAEHSNPVDAWGAIVQDDQKRSRYQRARGKGGFRRSDWDEVLELVTASLLYTAKTWGPDRVFGFAPIPAMSYLSYAGGSRFLQLFGGVNMSFYDWYADLPNAFPEIWGDQTDVCESADWYNSKYIVSMGANLNMTRTPDVHFISEARQAGAKFVVISPDFSQVAKYSDWWIPVTAGQDTALWMAVNHVILKEFYADRQVPYFIDYLKQYTDSPFLVELSPDGDGYTAGQLLRANRFERYRDVENGDWKLTVLDQPSGEARMPKGTVGYRWGEEMGKWNLKMEDGLDDTPIDPILSFFEDNDEIVMVNYHEFVEGKISLRGVPVKRVQTADGPVVVATAFDLLMAQFGVGRGLPGEYPTSYDDVGPYTPAWQENLTGIGRDTITRFAREFAGNAEATNGKSMVIVGASINHWYNNNLSYRAPITALILGGCCGVNGGGMNHYVGQEKLTLVAPWTSLAFALDWVKPPRRQQSPTWHYVNSDQWRYEGDFTDYAAVPPDAKWAKGHAMDLEAKSVRLGWMPYYPQFNRSSLDLVTDAEAAGASDNQEVVQKVVEQLKNKETRFAVDDPDAPENWPRIWMIWRGNAIQSSAKGSEFFLRHYLGTHDNVTAEERAAGKVKTVEFREPAPRGKMDLVVDINFRMDTSALYSDIVLPTAFWYEKNDLNTTDLHSFVHPLGEAVPPVWESKTDWEIFKAFAKKVSEMSSLAFDGPVKDLVATPLAHDTPDELAQTQVLDWAEGETEPVPGKTMPHLAVVERDYANLYNKFISLGPNVKTDGVTGNGVLVPVADQYDEMLQNPVGGSPDPRHMRCVEWGDEKYPSVEDALDAANVLLAMAPETNGEVSYAAFKHEEERTGLQLADLADDVRGVRMNFLDLTRQVRRTLITPCWTGMVNEGRAYSAWCINVERLIPWRTLSGRQHMYVDHPWYLDWGENLPTYKPKLNPYKTGDIVNSPVDDNCLVLNYITPHGKWNIHSTYKDNIRMLTLSRGMDPCWINDKDADKIGLKDNDWVEMYNDNGVVVTRAAVSSRVQQGMCLYYHAVERTVYIPKSQVLGGKRAGGHNSLTRTRINPVLLAGGYAQFTYGFNYWGPIGIFTRDTHIVVRKMEKLEW